MASADIKVNVTGLANLDRLKASMATIGQQTERLNNQFLGLKTALAGLGLAAFAREALLFADNLDEVSAASGITLARIIELQGALTAAGGKAGSAGDGISRFYSTVEQAAQGSEQAQNALMRIGVSFDDLRNKTPDQLLRKTIEQLAAIQDPIKRAAAQVEIFGKSWRSVETQKLAELYASAAGTGDQYAAAVKNAADMQENLARLSQNLQLILLTLFSAPIESLAQFTDGVLKSKDAMQQLGDYIATGLKIAAFVAAFTVVGKAVRVLGSVLAPVVALLARFSTVAKSVAGAAGEYLALVPGLAGVAAGMQAWSMTTDAVEEAQKKLASTTSTTSTKIDENNQRLAEQRKIMESQRFIAMRQQIADIGDAYAKSNNEVLKRLAIDKDLVTTTAFYVDLMKALTEADQRAAESTKKLTDIRERLAASEQNEKTRELIALVDAQIEQTKQLTQADKERITQAVYALELKKQEAALTNFAIKRQLDLEDQRLKIERESADLTLPRQVKAYEDIMRAADDAARAAIRAEEARRGAPLNEQEVKSYYDASRQGIERVRQAQQKLTEESRKFSTGWKRAFQDYVDEATNAAKIATRLFERFTSGLEDALLEFVKTGKFNWRKFVQDMGEELLRAQIKQTLASLGSAIGLGDLFGGGGTGATRGQSANMPLYTLDVGGGAAGGGVQTALSGILGGGQRPGGNIRTPDFNPGAQGGGILGTIGNVVSGIGGTVGKVVDSVGSIFGGITDTISNFFGGFFANGGSLPQGKFGIVGERGPEMITGPATITPMAATAVTYNINAVDAASFRQMIAADPGFLFAVTEQGRRSLPARR